MIGTAAAMASCFCLSPQWVVPTVGCPYNGTRMTRDWRGAILPGSHPYGRLSTLATLRAENDLRAGLNWTQAYFTRALQDPWGEEVPWTLDSDV